MKKNTKNNLHIYASLIISMLCINALECTKNKESLAALVADETILNSLDKQALDQFKRRVRINILHGLTVEKEVTHLYGDTKIILFFYYKDELIGHATCYWYKDEKVDDYLMISLNTFFITEIYRNYSLGTAFFEILKKELREHFSAKAVLYWQAIPLLFKPKNELTRDEEFNEAQIRLYKFYKNCRATVDEKTSHCFIHLDDTGEFDEKN